LNFLVPDATLDGLSRQKGREMFELRPRDDGPHDELVREARAAREAAKRSFQVFVPHDERRSPEGEHHDEFETALLADLLEAESWTLENVAHAAERDTDWAYGVQIATVVGTIYTFRPSTS
jgi:hypothetical protein